MKPIKNGKSIWRIRLNKTPLSRGETALAGTDIPILKINLRLFQTVNIRLCKLYENIWGKKMLESNPVIENDNAKELSEKPGEHINTDTAIVWLSFCSSDFVRD